MRPSLQGFFTALAVSAAFLMAGTPQNAKAAPSTDAVLQASICNSNPHVDPSVQICVTERDHITYYRIDSIDGTHAEVAMSKEGMTLQQSGPDTVSVLFGNTPVTPHDNAALYYGVSKRVYQDASLAIDEINNGQQAPTWIVSTNIQRLDPHMPGCNNQDCSGGIQHQYPQASGCTGESCSGAIQKN